MRRPAAALAGLLLLAACAGAPEPAPAGPEPLRLDVDGTGTIRLEGEAMPRERLVAKLAARADGPREESRPRRSLREVVIHAEPTTPWAVVFDALKLCSAPNVRLCRIALGAGGETERLELLGMFVRSDDAICIPPTVVAGVRPSPAGPEVVLLDRMEGTGDAGFAKLEEDAAAISRVEPDAPMAVEPDPKIEVRQVLRLLGSLRRAGFEPPRVPGAPPETAFDWAREDVQRAVAGLSGPQLVARLSELTRSPHRWVRDLAFGSLAEHDEAWPAILDAIRTAPDERDRSSWVGTARKTAKRLGPEAEAELEAARKGE